MKYQIDTIPVWDAVKENCECPFCLLEQRSEEKLIDFYLSDSVMQPHIRIKTNEIGLCAEHYSMMLESDRKLSLALMSHTHSKYLSEKIAKSLNYLANNSDSSNKTAKHADRLIESLESANKKCVICDDIKYDILRYIHTYIYLFKKDPQFSDAIKSSKGFCIKHFPQLIKAAQKDLSKKAFSAFMSDASKVQKENAARIEEEVKWYCDKFDHQNSDKPWGSSKDALPRMLTKLGGKLQK